MYTSVMSKRKALRPGRALGWLLMRRRAWIFDGPRWEWSGYMGRATLLLTLAAIAGTWAAAAGSARADILGLTALTNPDISLSQAVVDYGITKSGYLTVKGVSSAYVDTS